ncbi:DUF4183 domain-containing protein [Paenibacillus lutrae]|uniref:DUF4183 domain-containing protein n=1 Tax=Paenibacillus lutrae TaxID=2078573 RepID=A0A7X3FKM6_9BACL|nr:DUF4183 domain-containing protein [Paenibacillus lutrae]MVP01347.1 DUF4183 domain-containing protein [Paenibacillus lutrae]
MPPSLIKLFVTASSVVAGTVTTVTTTTVDDNVRRYHAVVTLGMIDGTAGTTTIPDTSFLDDSGTAVAAGALPVLPVLPAGGYYSLYINGVLQEGDLSALSTTELVIASAALLPGTPVIIETHDYSGTISASASTPALTVTTTMNT